MDDFWKDAVVISRYTRVQALADGVLVDAGELAREAGFRYPLALSSAAWAETVAWDKENGGLQDETGRLWDVLMMAQHGIRTRRPGQDEEPADRCSFEVLRVENTVGAESPELVELTVHIGPGDDPAPVFTIMIPGED